MVSNFGENDPFAFKFDQEKYLPNVLLCYGQKPLRGRLHLLEVNDVKNRHRSCRCLVSNYVVSLFSVKCVYNSIYYACPAGPICDYQILFHGTVILL